MRRLLVVLTFLAGAVVGGLLGGAADAEWASCVQLQRRVDSLGRELDIAQWYANRQWNDLAKVRRACGRR